MFTTQNKWAKHLAKQNRSIRKKKNHAQSRIPTGNKQYKDSKALNKNNKIIQMRKMKNETQ